MNRLICLTALVLTGVLASEAQTRYGTDARFVISIPTGNFGQNFNTGLGAELSFYWETEDYLRIAGGSRLPPMADQQGADMIKTAPTGREGDDRLEG